MSESCYQESKPRVLLEFEGEEFTFLKRTKLYNCNLEKAERLVVAVESIYNELNEAKNINDSLIVKIYLNELEQRILTLKSQKQEQNIVSEVQLLKFNQTLSMWRKLKILLVGGN